MHIINTHVGVEI